MFRLKEGWEFVGLNDLRPARDLTEAVKENKQLNYHGGCVFCLLALTGENKTLAGIEYCTGCQYMNANWSLPNKCLDTYKAGEFVDERDF